MKKVILSILTILTISIGLNAQIVNIPDANFKAYLVGNSSINTNADSEIQLSEANAYTGTINCSNLSISDLTGIEAFVNITVLICSNNNLTSIDISAILNLGELYCSDNQLTSLNTSLNTGLYSLSCANNALTSIDLSSHPNINTLYCNGNNITTLNLSNLTSLYDLDCSDNQITSIDASNIPLQYFFCQNNALTSLNVANGNNYIIVDFVATNNPNLTCIEVDDVVYSDANWTNIDATASFSLNCPLPCTVNIPDVSFKAYLVGNAAINTNGNSEIECSEASAFNGTFNCNSLSISDMTGLEAFTSLTRLSCSSNSLTNLDVSNNISLERIYCDHNSLTSLDVSNNTALIRLYCYNNTLASLDVTANTALLRLTCNDNLLTTLNVANGNNTNLGTFVATNNPNLTCIEVDDVAWSNTNWSTAIDAIANFSTDCVGSTVLVSSIVVQGSGGATTISTNGGTLQMFATVFPGSADDDTYTWSVANGTGSAAISAAGLLTASADGTVTVTATANDASGTTGALDITISNQSNSVILVNEITVGTAGGTTTISTNGGTLQMSATVLPATADDVTYTWSVVNGTGSATIDANGLLTAIADGTLDVVATANDASGISGIKTITITNQSVGINDLTFDKVNIYPNPTSGFVNIDKDEEIASMRLMDFSGRTVKVFNPESTQLEITELTTGIYFLELANAEKKSIVKIIKK